MSTACRQFRTTITTGSHKLLIVQGHATVAEGRQGGQEVTPPDNNCKRAKLKAVSGRDVLLTRFVARKGSHRVGSSVVLLVVLLRHYIGVTASLIIRHCERVNGKAPAMQRNLP